MVSLLSPLVYCGYISCLYSSVLSLELRILPFFILFDYLRLFTATNCLIGFSVQSDPSHTFSETTPTGLRPPAHPCHLRLSLVYPENYLHPLLILEQMLFCFLDLVPVGGALSPVHSDSQNKTPPTGEFNRNFSLTVLGQAPADSVPGEASLPGLQAVVWTASGRWSFSSSTDTNPIAGAHPCPPLTLTSSQGPTSRYLHIGGSGDAHIVHGAS